MTARCEWPACDCTNGTASCPKQRHGARWEPLETAEEVVAAFDAGRVVWQQVAKGLHWRPAAFDPAWDDADYFARHMRNGRKYRALIEDSK